MKEITAEGKIVKNQIEAYRRTIETLEETIAGLSSNCNHELLKTEKEGSWCSCECMCCGKVFDFGKCNYKDTEKCSR